MNTEYIMLLNKLCALQDGTVIPTILNEGLLESAFYDKDTSFGGYEVYSSKEEKAGSLLYHLIKNHSFSDGNKRTAAATFLDYLNEEGIKIEYLDTDLYAIVLAIANGTLTQDETVDWIRGHKSN